MLKYTWRGFGSDCESELDRAKYTNMADERRVPGACDVTARTTDQTVPATDHVDGKMIEFLLEVVIFG